MTLDVYNTHMELYPYEKGQLIALEDMFTAIDRYTLNEYPCGYLINEGKMYLPRGTPVAKLEMWAGVTATFKRKSDPKEPMSRKHSALYDPRNDLQEDSIKFLTTSTNHQMALNLGTGIGKSYVTLASASQISERILIVTHNTGLKKQWIRTATDMFDYKSSELLDINGSDVMESIIQGDLPEADIYFVNHQTLRSYLSLYGGFQLNNFFKKLRIGIKIYDEAHLEFANILLMDHFSNTNRTIYLTATFDRSDKTESKCFKTAFSTLDTFGEQESKEQTEKHIIYHAVYYKSRPDPYQMRQINRFGNMTAASFGAWAFLRDTNESGYDVIKLLVSKVKDLEGKILIFVPLIEAVDLVTKKLKLDFSDKSIGAYHSKVDRDEKESVLKKDIIVSTIKSCGTGRDIPGLRVLICLEPIASKVQTHQMLGRLRKYGTDMSTYFYDCIDVSIPPCNWYWKSRMKVIPNIVKQIIYLDLDSG